MCEADEMCGGKTHSCDRTVVFFKILMSPSFLLCVIFYSCVIYRSLTFLCLGYREEINLILS